MQTNARSILVTETPSKLAPVAGGRQGSRLVAVGRERRRSAGAVVIRAVVAPAMGR